MSAAPVNLNRARKARARDAKCAYADENAIRFGRTKAQKEAERIAAEHAARHLDGHERGE